MPTLFSDDDEIDPDDHEIQSMTATLTRRQSETVRKRIKSLNETLKRKRKESTSPPKRPDVRDIFPAKQGRENRGEPLRNGAAKQAQTQSNFYVVSLDSSHNVQVDTSTTRTKDDHDKVLDSETQDVDDGVKSTGYSVRKLPELMVNMFYTPRATGNTAVPPDLKRPPPPRRAQSEGVCQILKAQDSENVEARRHKLDKTRSEGCPLRTVEGGRKRRMF